MQPKTFVEVTLHESTKFNYIDMDKICKDCKYNKGWGCNRLVIPGGMGRHDRVASDYLKNNECNYYEHGKVEVDNNKPNFENS